MTTISDDDRRMTLEFLRMFKRGKRYYNLNKEDKRDLQRLIERYVSAVEYPDALLLG
jgi:hypothetical protein